MQNIKRNEAFEKIMQEATEAGNKAGAEKLAQLEGNGPAFAVIENSPKDGIFYDKAKPTRVVGTMLDVCGFAWVMLTNARGAFAQYFKKTDRASNGYRGGMTISVRFSGFRQEMSVNEAQARAAADVFNKYGFEARMESRID